jgi:DNA polymerase I
LILAVDTENNTWNKGAPYDRRFKSICYSWADSESSGAAKWDVQSLELLRGRVREVSVLVGFNLKYDLHVLEQLGIKPPEGCVIWDCQIAQFVASKQQMRYPSLNESCNIYGLGTKIDVIAEKYWDNGIQTEDIPWDELAEYAEQDAKLTLALYHAQQDALSASQRQLVRLQGLDLLVLQEMEKNGLTYDNRLLEERAQSIREEIHELTGRLHEVYRDVPINFNSGDDLSAFLYGGTIEEEVRVHVGFFKTGKQAGEAKYKKEIVTHELPRLVPPIRGSELKKKGFYQTNGDTLLKLKGTRKTKEIIEIIQKRTRLDSLLTKTYEGVRKVNVNQNWDVGILHGQYNQCVAQTGRLSSSNPNLQNLDSAAQDLFVSRYND